LRSQRREAAKIDRLFDENVQYKRILQRDENFGYRSATGA